MTQTRTSEGEGDIEAARAIVEAANDGDFSSTPATSTTSRMQASPRTTPRQPTINGMESEDRQRERSES